MMKRLSNIITLLCLLTVLSINYGPNIVSDGSGTQIVSEDDDQNGSTDEQFRPYDRTNRSFVDEPIHPKVEKSLFVRFK